MHIEIRCGDLLRTAIWMTKEVRGDFKTYLRKVYCESGRWMELDQHLMQILIQEN
jgi:hypothetical protein